ncbi:MAG: amidohydrolase family protein [Chloroflexi bacterium]|nr:amidohydrolase family protein [Chloroflexota bacterium]
MAAQLLIRGGTVVSPGQGMFPADVVVEDGRIAALLAPSSGASAARVIDAAGRYVMPGVIDPHLHIGLGNGHDEWASETRSAAAGGVTAVFHFLMASSSYLPLYQETREAADPRAHVDYGFHLVPCAPVHLEEMPRYVEAGVTSFKYFTSFRGDEGSHLNLAGTDDGYLYTYFEQVARYDGALAAIHPENIEVVWQLRKRLQEAGRDDLPAWDESRPDFVEAECCYRTLFYAKQTGAPIYLVHISGAMPLDEIRAWRARFPGARVYAETCPHSLTRTKDDPIGSLGKINPPLRTRSDVEALWAGIADGTIDTIGSDHAARRRERKTGNIWKTSAGFPGTATILPVMLSEGVHKRGLSLLRVSEVCSANVARIFGLYPRKGSLQVGADADLVLVDLDLERTVTPEVFQSYADYSLYDGWKLKGWPVMTVLRGEVIMESGQVVGRPGYGRYLARRATRRG